MELCPIFRLDNIGLMVFTGKSQFIQSYMAFALLHLIDFRNIFEITVLRDFRNNKLLNSKSQIINIQASKSSLTTSLAPSVDHIVIRWIRRLLLHHVIICKLD